MASISEDRGRDGKKNGSWRIQFFTDGNRLNITLGKMTKRNAATVKVFVEDLVASQKSGSTPQPKTSEWLGTISEELHAKFVKAGIARPRKRFTEGLEDFLTGYLEKVKDVRKPNTLRHLQTVANNLVEHFGASFDMGKATRADADDFRRFLQGKGLQPNAVNRRMGRAKQFWKAAVDRELISNNPFLGQDCTVRPVESKFRYVSQEEAQKLIDAAPCDDWRLIIALARYAGLRCPSEVLTLTWENVDLEAGEMNVFSPKLEGNANGGWRRIPVFHQVRPYLEAVRGDDQGRVIKRYRDADQNLRTTFYGICRKAGVEQYRKPFQNLRSSAANDLNQEFPQHVVAEWHGHSEAVAKKFYLRPTDEDFARAVRADSVQKVSETVGTDRKWRGPKSDKPLEIDLLAFETSHIVEAAVPPQGLEP